ncbi:unnamed protein product, partial [marine sediment metagenome]
KDAVLHGFLTGAYFNCYSHGHGNTGFSGSAMAVNCIAEGNSNAGFVNIVRGCVNCIGKDNTGDNFFMSGSAVVNCISDGGTGQGIGIAGSGFAANCIIIDSAAGKYGLKFDNANVAPALHPSSAYNINFYNCDENSDRADLINTYHEVDPQFNDASVMDYTRTGDNLDDLGFSEIGTFSAFDYEIDIGPFQRKEAGAGATEITGDPFTETYDAIWGTLTDSTDFEARVKPGNRLKYTGGRK